MDKINNQRSKRRSRNVHKELVKKANTELRDITKEDMRAKDANQDVRQKFLDLISLSKQKKGAVDIHKTIKNVYRDSSSDDNERDIGKHTIRSDLDKSGANALLSIT